MDNLISRYRNVSVLVAVLFAQVVGLAVQLKRSPDSESSRLIRVWAVSAITPLEKAFVWVQNGSGNLWREYVYLRGVRQENRDLKQEIAHLRLQQVRLSEDAAQARRLQALLAFKEQFIARTVAAQVISSCGSQKSGCVYIDKGSEQGIRTDMAVITADGVVGKVLRVYGSTSQVLLINDQSSGVGAILEKARLQGVLRGTVSGDVLLEKVMADEDIRPGDAVLTSGGDQVFPKGFPAGVVTHVSRTADSFLNIRIKPAANLSKLEEVLVITQREDRVPAVAQTGMRAADILAQRLPSVPEKPPEAAKPGSQPAAESNTPPRSAGDKTQPPAPLTPKSPAGVNKPQPADPERHVPAPEVKPQ